MESFVESRCLLCVQQMAACSPIIGATPTGHAHYILSEFLGSTSSPDQISYQRAKMTGDGIICSIKLSCFRIRQDVCLNDI